MLKKAIFILAVALCLTSLFTPEAEAVDPVTLSLLAPYAMPVAEAAAQYAIRGMLNTVPGFIEIGRNIFAIFLLPIGIIECTLGAPFGFLGSGINHVIGGLEAPFMLVFEILVLPVRAVGVNP